MRTHFGREWRAVASYHLCVDTDALGVEGGAELVLQAARLRFGEAALRAASGAARPT